MTSKSFIIFAILFGNFLYSFETFSKENEGLVEVEPLNALPTTVGSDNKLEMLSYDERRTDWGGHFGLQYSMYEPKEYSPDFAIQNFDTIYESADIPLLEINFGFKRNVSLGSFGIEFAAGYYESESVEVTISDSTLTLIPLRIGLHYIADNIWTEPIFAPYIEAGAYVVKYKEESNTADITVDGTTFPAPYFKGGLLFQLNWVEERSARVAYQESGVENTFIFVEGRMFTESSKDKDPDFSDVHAAAGLKIEF